MKKTIEINAHACVTENSKFQCLLCNEETHSQALFDTEIGVMAHMLYTHLLAPDKVIITGWSQEMVNNLKEQIKRNNWNLDEDISFFLSSRNENEARIFREGKAETVLLKVRKIENEEE
jgi:hypothetical protein